MNDAAIIAACRAAADALLAYAETVPTLSPTMHVITDNSRQDLAWARDSRRDMDDDPNQDPNRQILYVSSVYQYVHQFIRELDEDPDYYQQVGHAAYRRERNRVFAAALLHCWSLLPRITPDTDQREQDYRAARIGTVRALIDRCGPGDFLNRLSLESQLAEMEADHPTP